MGSSAADSSSTASSANRFFRPPIPRSAAHARLAPRPMGARSRWWTDRLSHTQGTFTFQHQPPGMSATAAEQYARLVAAAARRSGQCRWIGGLAPGPRVVRPQPRSGSNRMRTLPQREDAGTMIPSENADLRRVGRGLIGRRWTSVVTSAGVGVVLVALAARFGAAVAAATAMFAVAAVLAAVWLAIIEDRRWRREFRTVRDVGADSARRSSIRRPQ